MPLLRLNQVSLNFGTHVLLDAVDFTLRKGERIGLLGRNGAGKTTLLKVISGEVVPESGERWVRSGVRISYLVSKRLSTFPIQGNDRILLLSKHREISSKFPLVYKKVAEEGVQGRKVIIQHIKALPVLQPKSDAKYKP